MRLFGYALAVWGLVVVPLSAAGQGAPAPPIVISLPEYVAALDRLHTEVSSFDARDPAAAEKVLADLPTAWRVVTPDATFEISTDWIGTALRAWRLHPDTGQSTRLADRVRQLRDEAVTFGDPPSDAADARARVNAILAQREFKGIHGPTWFDRLKQRFVAWLVGVLREVVGLGTMSVVSTVMAIGLIGVAVVLVALWIHRRLGRRVGLTPMHVDRADIAAAPWSTSIEDARRAASYGDWPRAIYLAYWCAIAQLEAQGAWRPDRARTPREYLHLLPSANVHQRTLLALTALVERVWYAAEPADAVRFDEALSALKQLGCRII